jgi:hypothetical protein
MENIEVRLERIIRDFVQNPGWNAGSVVKVYGSGRFVAATNFGQCLAYGSLDQLGTDFEAVRTRLDGEGLLAAPRTPLTTRAAHFRTRFIELAMNGVSELRTDADDFDKRLSGAPSTKLGFTSLINKEETFVDSLLKAGMKPPTN